MRWARKRRFSHRLRWRLAGAILLVATAWLVQLPFGGDRQQPAERDSPVLALVSQSPQQRASQLQAIARQGSERARNRARYLLAADAIAQNQGERALKWLDGLAERYSLLAPQIAFDRAHAYLLAGELERSRDQLRQLLERYPEAPVAARALDWLGWQDPRYWQRGVTQFPSHPSSVEMARQLLDSESEQVADPAPLWLAIARFAPQPERASEARDRLMALAPEGLDSQDWAAIAAGYWDERAYGKAARAYARAAEIPAHLYRRGRGYQLSNQRISAAEAYERLLREFPQAPEAGSALLRLAEMADRGQALHYFNRAIHNFPDKAPQARATKAQLLASVSRHSAQYHRERLLAEHPHSEPAAQYRWHLAQQQAEAGHLEAAMQQAAVIARDNADSSLAPRAAFWRGKWAAQLGQDGTAREAFQRVLRAHTASYYAWRSASLLGRKVGDFRQLRSAERSVQRPQQRPGLPAGSDAVEELYRLGQDERAWAAWRVANGSASELTVREQFTEGLLRIARGDYLQGLNRIWTLQQRDGKQAHQQWQALRQQPKYWHALFPLPYYEAIAQQAQQYRLDPLLVTAIIRRESRFEPDMGSSAGAIGLMQLIPSTASRAAERLGLSDYDLRDPQDSLRLGSWYLARLHGRYEGNALLMVASYNAGVGNVNDWLEQRDPNDPDAFVAQIPFDETRNYVKAVFGNYWNYLRLYDPSMREVAGSPP